jgi:NhaP-type Na+/H+ or K+/H+ antiporter
MLLSLALIFLCGMTLGSMFKKLRLPSLLGMLLAGILIGPYVLNLLNPTILSISTDLRQIALIIILLWAGLNLDINDFRRMGRPAILICFIPACFEIAGMFILAPIFLGITRLEAAIMGTVIAAVSPAVIVPKMLRLMKSGYGRSKNIPQMILAGASVDNVFVIILFTAFTNFAKNGNVALPGFLTIPTSIIFGLIGGIITGLFLALLFSKLHVRDSGKVIITLSFSFLLITIEHGLTGVISFSGLLSIVAMGATLHQKKHELSKKLSGKFSKLWVCAEVLLFVLVGAAVNISYVLKAGLIAIALIFCVLVFRMAGVFVCLIKTPLNKKERVFSALACIPKATVQAAIGALPLVMGLACGDTILTVAVLSILITAPLGAALADATYKKLLDKETIDLKRTTGIPGVNRARERLNYFSK